MIDPAVRDFLEPFIRKTAIANQVSVLALAILRTHVHLVIRAKPKHDLPELLQHLKGGSSYAINRLPGNVLGLRWTPEYSITTVSPRLLKDAIKYVEAQERRHPGEAVSPLRFKRNVVSGPPFRVGTGPGLHSLHTNPR